MVYSLITTSFDIDTGIIKHIFQQKFYNNVNQENPPFEGDMGSLSRQCLEIMVPSYPYNDFHSKEMMVIRPSNLYDRNSYTDNMTS